MWSQNLEREGGGGERERERERERDREIQTLVNSIITTHTLATIIIMVETVMETQTKILHHDMADMITISSSQPCTHSSRLLGQPQFDGSICRCHTL